MAFVCSQQKWAFEVTDTLEATTLLPGDSIIVLVECTPLEGGRRAITDKRTRRGRDPLLDENRRLKKLAGQQALIIEAPKKLAGILG